METRRYLRYSRVPSRVPRLRTSAWAGYDTRALDKEGLGDVKLVSPIRTIDTQIIKCVSTLVSQTWCFGVKEGAQYDKRPSQHAANDLKVPEHSKERHKKVLWCQRRGTVWQETHHTADDLRVPDHSLGREKRKGNPDGASILFGKIRHCEHKFHLFPEKSSASITCTFC